MITNDEWIEQTKLVVQMISDEKYQLETWFGLGLKASSPDELCNQFDDLNVSSALLSEDDRLASVNALGRISLLKLGEMIDKTPDFTDPIDAFVSCEWAQLRRAAKVCTMALT